MFGEKQSNPDRKYPSDVGVVFDHAVGFASKPDQTEVMMLFRPQFGCAGPPPTRSVCKLTFKRQPSTRCLECGFIPKCVLCIACAYVGVCRIFLMCVMSLYEVVCYILFRGPDRPICERYSYCIPVCEYLPMGCIGSKIGACVM